MIGTAAVVPQKRVLRFALCPALPTARNLAGWVLKKGVGAGKGIAKKIRSKKSDNGESGDGGSADGEDRYTESPAPSDGSEGAASGDAASAEENTDTGGSE